MSDKYGQTVEEKCRAWHKNIPQILLQPELHVINEQAPVEWHIFQHL
jgi:hypothetical protein